MTFRRFLLVATAVSAPTVALAQPVDGLYVSLAGGGTDIKDQDLRSVAVPTLSAFSSGTANNGKIVVGANGMLSGGIGYGLGDGIRLELQGDWRADDFLRFGGLKAGGKQDQYEGYFNALYDFDLAPLGLAALSPFVGLGIGYDEVYFTHGHASGFGGSPSQPISVDQIGGRGDLAVQGIVGLAYNIAALPGLAVTLEGRVSDIPEDRTYMGRFLAPGVTTRVDFKTGGTLNFAGLIGIRYTLTEPEPPLIQRSPPPAAAAAAPEPVPSRTYLVFFDWDRAELSDRARQIVSDAAKASTHVQATKIEVNGYTDLSGTAVYNQKLSMHRAESVEAELVRDGVPAQEIAIRGYGEANPLVPTALGVREPQNRRVEIILK